nr:uncharacterized protein LOC117280973 [Nicotiana tomentosiformis]
MRECITSYSSTINKSILRAKENERKTIKKARKEGVKERKEKIRQLRRRKTKKEGPKLEESKTAENPPIIVTKDIHLKEGKHVDQDSNQGGSTLILGMNQLCLTPRINSLGTTNLSRSAAI